MSTLRDMRVLITGAAGGIGSELARQLSAEGASLALVDVQAEALRRVAEALSATAIWSVTDITRLGELEVAMADAVARFGGLDALVANAGVVTVASVEQIDPAEFDRVIEVNLLGTWRTARAALPHLIASKGYLLFVSSLAGDLQGPLHASYNASKAGIQAFANTLRLEVEGLSVQIGVAHLNYTDTETARAAVGHPAMRKLSGMRTMRPIPTTKTAAALARAIERRSRRIVTPRVTSAALPIRDFLQRRLEGLARRRSWAAAIREPTEPSDS